MVTLSSTRDRYGDNELYKKITMELTVPVIHHLKLPKLLIP